MGETLLSVDFTDGERRKNILVSAGGRVLANKLANSIVAWAEKRPSPKSIPVDLSPVTFVWARLSGIGACCTCCLSIRHVLPATSETIAVSWGFLAR